MIKYMIKVIVYLAIVFAIMAIGANTGGNKGLNHSWDKLKKKDQDTVTLKSVLCDLLLVVVFAALGIIDMCFVKEDKIVLIIMIVLLEIMYVVIFIRNLKKYKSRLR